MGAAHTRIDETAPIDSTGVLEFLGKRREFITPLSGAAAWPRHSWWYRYS
jgi:hypothetical protein